jgi:hypothetical protein
VFSRDGPEAVHVGSDRRIGQHGFDLVEAKCQTFKLLPKGIFHGAIHAPGDDLPPKPASLASPEL